MIHYTYTSRYIKKIKILLCLIGGAPDVPYVRRIKRFQVGYHERCVTRTSDGDDQLFCLELLVFAPATAVRRREQRVRMRRVQTHCAQSHDGPHQTPSARRNGMHVSRRLFSERLYTMPTSARLWYAFPTSTVTCCSTMNNGRIV